jgi:oligoendopeptidase F
MNDRRFRLMTPLSAAVAVLVMAAYFFPGQGDAMTTETAAPPIPDKDRWSLSELYATDEAWSQARAAFEKKIDAMAAHRGHLGVSPQTMLAALRAIDALMEEYRRLSSYAAMKSDLDKANAANLARSQEMEQIGARLDAATSFLAPEVLALPEGAVEKFLKAEPALARYAHDLRDVERRRPHTLSPEEEKLLADAGTLSGSAQNLYEVLATADLPFPEVTLASGEKVRIDQSAYVRHRTSARRDDRLAVFRGFFTTWKGYERTLGVALDAELRKNIFFARSRRYGSSLEASLDRNHVPARVYDAMLETANESLPTLHRYLKLRARILGVSDLGYHDIYAPLIPKSARSYSIDEARKLVLAAVAPLGPDYVATLSHGYENRWVDVWPSRGKRSGAYSNGSVYAEHPFILMNYTGNFDGVSTLAHESGHAMHSWLANHAQPVTTADYSIFVAEVASTFNEALLYRYAIDHAKDDGEKLSLLSAWLDGARGTYFRQAMFAEFERGIARAAESGESLTGESLDRMYLSLVRKYHGSEQGVCAVDDLYSVEWACIPHFYANFYVYQYSTGFAASTSLARRVLGGEPGARDRFLDFLKAGGSDYPFELLKKAGVDLTRPDPYRETVAEMNRTMDEIDAILAKKG